MLLAIMIPIFLAVSLLRHMSLFYWIAETAQPAMRVFGLPGSAVLPLITGVFADEYALVAALSGFPFDKAQITIIAMISLCLHGAPVEAVITKKIGMPAGRIVLFRVGLAVATGIVCAYLAAAFLGGNAPEFSLGGGGGGGAGGAGVGAGVGDAAVSIEGAGSAAVSIEGAAVSIEGAAGAGFIPYEGTFWDAGRSQVLREMGAGVLTMVLNLLRVIVPLMVGIEFMLAYNIVEWLEKKLTLFCRLLGIGHEALLPLLVGLFLGVTYGAGALAEMNRTKPLGKRDMALLGVFIFSCHGIIETTYLFAVANASVVFICGLRLGIAVVVTAIAARTVFRGKPAL